MVIASQLPYKDLSLQNCCYSGSTYGLGCLKIFPHVSRLLLLLQYIWAGLPKDLSPCFKTVATLVVHTRTYGLLVFLRCEHKHELWSRLAASVTTVSGWQQLSLAPSTGGFVVEMKHTKGYVINWQTSIAPPIPTEKTRVFAKCLSMKLVIVQAQRVLVESQSEVVLVCLSVTGLQLKYMGTHIYSLRTSLAWLMVTVILHRRTRRIEGGVQRYTCRRRLTAQQGMKDDRIGV